MSSCTAADLYKTAEKLKSSLEASDRRTAINRSYYAALHDLTDKLYPMAKESDLGQHRTLKHGATTHLLRKFREAYPDQKTRMAHGAEAVKMANRFVACLVAREDADYCLGDEFVAKPQKVVEHFGRVDRLRKFAAKLP